MLCHSPISYRGICGSPTAFVIVPDDSILVDIDLRDHTNDLLIPVTVRDRFTTRIDIESQDTNSLLFNIDTNDVPSTLVRVTGVRTNSTVFRI